MKKILLFLFIAITLNSCIEIRQEITINEDQSGKISLVLDMGSIANSLMNSAGKYINMDFLKQIQTFPKIAVAKINGLEGISNLKAIDGNGMYGVSYDFKDSKSLNKSFYKLINQKKTIFKPSLLKIKKHKISLINISPYLKLYYRLNKKDIANEEIFNYITYKVVINLPQPLEKISKNKESLAYKSEDKKQIVFSFPLYEMLKKSLDTDIKIKY